MSLRPPGEHRYVKSGLTKVRMSSGRRVLREPCAGRRGGLERHLPPRRLALPPCTGAAMLLSPACWESKGQATSQACCPHSEGRGSVCSSPFPSLAGVTTLYPGPCRHLRSSGKHRAEVLPFPFQTSSCTGHLPHTQPWAPVHRR